MRFKLSVSLLFCFCAIISYAQQKVVKLYSDKAPGSEAWAWQEKEQFAKIFNTQVVYNVSQPTLTVYPADPSKATGTAVIIAPGGAFHILSINSEGTEVAKWLNAKGITAFVLKYRLVHSVTDDPVTEMMSHVSDKRMTDSVVPMVVKMAMNDGLTAVKWVRSHAKDYGIDTSRIGFMGFSAGGTVTMSVIYSANAESRPNFIAPIYAYTGAVIGSNIPKEKTPAFIVAATDDQLGLASNSVDIYSKWIASKQSAELHIFSKGGHGFGMRKQNLPVDAWIERFGDWLKLNNYIK